MAAYSLTYTTGRVIPQSPNERQSGSPQASYDLSTRLLLLSCGLSDTGTGTGTESRQFAETNKLVIAIVPLTIPCSPAPRIQHTAAKTGPAETERHGNSEESEQKHFADTCQRPCRVHRPTTKVSTLATWPVVSVSLSFFCGRLVCARVLPPCACARAPCACPVSGAHSTTQYYVSVPAEVHANCKLDDW